MNILKLFHNKDLKNWEVCKSCGGKVEYHEAVWWRWLVFNDGGYIECTNCGKVIVVP